MDVGDKVLIKDHGKYKHCIGKVLSKKCSSLQFTTYRVRILQLLNEDIGFVPLNVDVYDVIPYTNTAEALFRRNNEVRRA